MAPPFIYHSAIVLSVVILNVIMLNVVILSVVAPVQVMNQSILIDVYGWSKHERPIS